MKRRALIAAGAALPLRAAAQRPSVALLVGDNSPREFVLPLLRLIADGGDFGWSLRFVPWARLLALSGQGEALAFGLSRNDERERIYAFSEPVFTNHVWIVVRAGEPAAFGGLEESIHIVAAQGTAQAEAMARVNAGIRARRHEIRALVDSGV